MTVKGGQYRFIDPAIPPPPGQVCERIATNQIGPLQEMLQEPTSSQNDLWTGGSSGEQGRHQMYVYEPSILYPGAIQQWLVMTEVTGDFTDGEALTAAPI